MIADPQARGRFVAEFYFRLEPALWQDLEGSRVLPSPLSADARHEWECFALYACVRGLVAAGGFNVETVAAVDHLHDAVVERWSAAVPASDAPAHAALAARRERVAARYAEYGRIGQELEAKGAALVTQRLGEAAAQHVSATEPPSADLATTLGDLHEALAEGAAEAVRESV